MENREHCKYIADRVEAYTNGDMYICPECGGHANWNHYACDCGKVIDTDEWEQASLWDYFADLLDIDFVIDRNKEYKACRILVAFGGPNIYIDTLSRNVELYWWNERASYPLDPDAVAAVDDWAAEYYNFD